MEPKATFVDYDNERGRESVDTSSYRVWVRVLVLKYRRTRLNSEVSYSVKDSYPKEKDTRQKEEGRQTKNIWREKMFQQKCLG